MGPFFYVMAIMGCGDAGDACAEARVMPIRFSSIQACQAAVPALLARNTDLDYPVVQAACRSNAPRMAQAGTHPRG